MGKSTDKGTSDTIELLKKKSFIMMCVHVCVCIMMLDSYKAAQR